ncbi:hypothetical protein PMAYCL1PPCAC_31365, partial [Pristionchus mayeri]
SRGSLLMPHHFVALLLLLIPTVIGQYSPTRVDISNIAFNTPNPFITYFNGANGNGMAVQCECTGSSGQGDAKSQVTKWNQVDNSERYSPCDDMSFEFNNPAEWITITCNVRLRMVDNNDNAFKTISDVVQLFAAQDDENFAPNLYPIQVKATRFPDHTEWVLTASVNKRCSAGEAMNFNCDNRCTAVSCSNQANICCTEQADLDKCTCIDNQGTCAPPSSTPPEDKNDPQICTNEDLYFWIMIGLACLSGLLLILLIICLIYICCALSSEDDARKAQQQQQPETVRPPPPVYLSTPPRDPRYGYRGPPPLDPYGRPEAGYREEYVGVPAPTCSSLRISPSQDTDFDSLAAEWTEPSTRREARV